MSDRAPHRAAAAMTAALVASAAVAAGIGSGAAHARRAAAAPDPPLPALPALPPSPRPAFTPKPPVLLHRSAREARWAPVVRAVVARRAPRPDAAAVAPLATTTPEGTTNVVAVVRQAASTSGLWALVRLAVLPNGSTGWVPRAALGGYGFTTTQLVVDRSRLVATLFRNGRAVFRAPVGVGLPQWPTPPGRFYVREKLTRFSSPFYGPIAFGTNARSTRLTDWPGGGFIGIHGTNRPDLLPGRVSHGCIRLRNDDIVRLARLLPVGAPLTIR
jgi:lipoprotein-anchoring transpeptidase ErfK/SrfK